MKAEGDNWDFWPLLLPVYIIGATIYATYILVACTIVLMWPTKVRNEVSGH